MTTPTVTYHKCEKCGAELRMGLVPLKPGVCHDCKMAEKYTPAELQAQAERRRVLRLPEAERKKLARRNPYGAAAQSLPHWRSNMSTEIAIRDEDMTQIATTGFNAQQIEVLKNSIMPGASNEDLALFQAQCVASRLNPFRKEIWALPFSKNVGTQEHKKWTTVWVPFASIDGLRVAAQRNNPNFVSMVGPIYYDKTGAKHELVWLKDEPPAACAMGVMLRGAREPVWGIAKWSEYEAHRGRKGSMWSSMPTRMLEIAAERQALRRACPNMPDLKVQGYDETGAETDYQPIEAPEMHDALPEPAHTDRPEDTDEGYRATLIQRCRTAGEALGKARLKPLAKGRIPEKLEVAELEELTDELEGAVEAMMMEVDPEDYEPGGEA